MAYEKTTVDAMRSWSEINRILYAHGCEGTSYTEVPDKGFQIEFVRRKDGRPLLVRIPVEYTYQAKATPNQREQEKRTKWRSLYNWLKAQFDAIDKGIVSYEQAFLADCVVLLPGGVQSRVIDAIRPELRSGEEYDLSRLLPPLKARTEPVEYIDLEPTRDGDSQ
jgi:hypothetical protein